MWDNFKLIEVGFKIVKWRMKMQKNMSADHNDSRHIHNQGSALSHRTYVHISHFTLHIILKFNKHTKTKQLNINDFHQLLLKTPLKL